MSKIDIEYRLKNKNDIINKKISGIINTNRIVYIDDDVKTTIIIDDTIKMLRECKDYTLDFIFTKHTKTIGNYNLNEYNISIPLYIDTKDIIFKDGYFKIEYNLFIDKEDKGLYILELNYKNI